MKKLSVAMERLPRKGYYRMSETSLPTRKFLHTFTVTESSTHGIAH